MIVVSFDSAFTYHLITPHAHQRQFLSIFPTCFVPLMIGLVLLLAFGSFSKIEAASGELPSAQEVLKTARSVNAYWQARNEYGNSDWARATYQTGNMALYQITGDAAIRDYSIAWGQTNNWGLVGTNLRNADAHTCGQIYCDLYTENPQTIYLTKIKAAIDGMVNSTKVDDWFWIDAFYMAAPTFARLGKIYNNPAYTEKAWLLYQDMGWRRGLFDEEDGLWYRDERFIHSTGEYGTSPNGNKVFWSRGNGWVFAGLMRVLDQLPADHPRRAGFELMFKRMAASLLSRQGADGFWRGNLADPAHVTNPETSGTSFFLAGFAWGIRNGLLDDATYRPAVAAGWNGLTTIAMNGTGYVGYIQNIGDRPTGTGFNSSSDFGIGAVLLAATEIYQIAELLPFFVSTGAPKTYEDFSGTGSAVVELTSSVEFETEPTEPAQFTWTIDGNVIGTGSSLRVRLPVGIHYPRLTVFADGESASSQTRVEIRSAAYRLIGFSSEETSNPAVNVLDGSLSTRWSAYGLGQWLLFDFGVPVEVPSLAASFYQGNARKYRFRIEVSLDGDTWSPVGAQFISSGTSLELQSFTLPPTQPFRFLRFIGDGNSANPWNSVTGLSFNRTLSKHDSNSDGIPDGWMMLNMGHGNWNAGDDPSGKGTSLLTDYIAGTDPLDKRDRWQVSMASDAGGLRMEFPARGPDFTGALRKYTVFTSADLSGAWEPLPGYTRISPAAGTVSLSIPEPSEDRRFYRVGVDLDL